MKIGKDYIGVGTGAVILNEKNQILLLLRKKDPEAGFWAIPGGKVELFEEVEKAVIREIKEEIGVETRINKLLGVTNHIIENEKTHWLAPVFLLEIINGVPKNIEPDKHEKIDWFDLNKLPQNITITAKNAVEYLKNQL